MALKDAVQDIVDELKKLDDIRRVPDNPPESNNQFPFAIVYPIRGLYMTGPPGVMKGLHNINIELHVARRDLPRDFDIVMDLFDQIPDQLLTTLKDSGFSNLETFGNIEYEFGPLSYAGVDTIGVTYLITGVKIQTIL